MVLFVFGSGIGGKGCNKLSQAMKCIADQEEIYEDANADDDGDDGDNDDYAGNGE